MAARALVAAATVAADVVTTADTFVRAWVGGSKLNADAFPAPPTSVGDMYAVHEAIAAHPMVSNLGGVGGYKLGAIGAEGEACLCAPLFKNFLVEAPGEGLSCAAIGLRQIEPEVGIIMKDDLEARPDGQPHSVATVWAAVDAVVLCIECCGRRGTVEAYDGTTALGKFQDTLSSGGVVLGTRLPAAQIASPAALKCATSLFVNDERAAEGSGANAPEGGPVEAVTWLANHLNRRGGRLRAGDVVATGQCCNTKACKAGDRVRATYEGLGAIEMVLQP